MKPHVICHMVTSVDGRTLNSRWRPQGLKAGNLFETIHEKLGGDAWLIGRVTGSEFAKAKAYPPASAETFPRTNWYARRKADAWGVVLDAHVKIAWGRSDIGGDPILVVLTEQVSDAHLAGLRSEGISWIFAGRNEIDLAMVLETLGRELGIKRVLLEGGGGTNGSFLRAGLVDELSVVICPAVDGAQGAPSLFDSTGAESASRAPVTAVKLVSTEILEGGAVWLRYQIENA